MLSPKLEPTPQGAMFLIVGAGVATTARAMSMTFLAIELQQVFGLGPALIGLLLGIGPLLGAALAPLIGAVSDRIGRKTVLTVTMASISLAMIAIALADTILVVCLAQTLAAVAIAIYGPIARALLTDICPPPLRLKYFSWRYMASNLGWTLGPMIGIAAGAASTPLFLASGLIYALLALTLHLLKLPRPLGDLGDASDVMPLVGSIKVAIRDPRMILFIAGGTLLIAVYGQWTATLAPYLAGSITGGVEIFAYLVSINGAIVLIGNPFARRYIEYAGALRALVTGCVLLMASQIGFIGSSGLLGFAAAMAIFTIGEILVVPSEYLLIDGISDEQNRGSYYGAHALSSAGSFLGPTLGGAASSFLGPSAMFSLFAGFAAASALFYISGKRPPPKTAGKGRRRSGRHRSPDSSTMRPTIHGAPVLPRNAAS